MFNIIVVSHGLLSAELVTSAEMIAGKQEQVCTLGLDPGCDLGVFTNKLDVMFADASKNGKFLVLTDLMYGTPFNTVVCLMNKYDFNHFSGINLPIYLEFITSRGSKDIDELCNFVKTEGKSTFVFVNDLLKEVKCE
jgi:mannose PTS system EIIA component